MAKVKVTAKFKILDLLDRFVDSALVNSIGREIVSQSKDMIAGGQSPVRGYGRFDRYKDSDKYPGKLKQQRPVNLYLSGEMLKELSFKKIDQTTIEYGILSRDRDILARAKAHNEGTANMSQRKFIPGSGEEFAVTIMRALRAEYGKRLSDLIKQSNKK